MNKWRVVFWTTLALVFVIPSLIPQKPKMSYMAPRFPKEVVTEPGEAELKRIARYIAHQTSGNVRLGTIPEGKKALIVVRSRKQDMRLLKAVIEAMRERNVEVDYIFEDDLLSEALAIPKNRVTDILRGDLVRGVRPEGRNGLLRQLRKGEWGEHIWPRLLPEQVRQKMRKEAGTVADQDRGNTPFKITLQQAIRRYVYELHPEYDAVVGGRSRQEYMKQNVGPKWNSLWPYRTIRNFQLFSTSFPTDVWRLSEDKIMQTLPWIEEVHIYDPEGTDIRFSVTPKEAEAWAKAAYLPNHLFLNPLQGTRGIYFHHGLRDVVVPKANGVVAGTTHGRGAFPHMKIYVEDGLVTHVEGGGRYKETWDGYLSNEDLSNAQVPHFPKKGWLWLYEISFGANPKVISPYTGLGSSGRSGVFHWGFGIEHGNPEIVQYLKERNLPNDHGLHLQTYFTTYEIKIRGKNKWVKFVDRGHLSLLADPEVRALASRYGNADEILQVRWVPDIPGINAPGNYFPDYGKDPASHIAEMTQRVQDGTYPYLK